jgi:hypothetical protein
MSILLRLAGSPPTPGSDPLAKASLYDPRTQLLGPVNHAKTVEEALEVYRFDATTGCGSTKNGGDADPDDQ